VQAGRTALIWAIAGGRTAAVQLLLDAGANVNTQVLIAN
jgi:ankyrin repeat protein